MASTIVQVKAPPNLTLTLNLFAFGSDTVANTGGDTLTEETNRQGVYLATVTESLTGWHDATIEDGSSNLIGAGAVYLADDTSTYRVHDHVPLLTDDVTLANINAEVDTALDTSISELGVGAPTATPSVRTGLMLLYMALRNKLVVQTSGTDALEVYNDAGTKIASKLITDDGSDYTEAEMS